MKAYKFPVKDCKAHAFCNYPYTEDVANLDTADLKSYLKSLSPNKKYNLSEREIISTNTLSTELDVKYLKKIQDRMDDHNSVKFGIPIVTEEGLSDWCQQSINRRFPVIPNIRPFMVSKPIYEYLKSVQDIKKTPQGGGNNAASRELITQGEIQSILENNKVNIYALEPRTMENGTAFMYPRQKDREKPRKSLINDNSGKIAQRSHSARSNNSNTTYTRARSSVMSQILHQFNTEVKEYHGNLRTDSHNAREIYEGIIKEGKIQLKLERSLTKEKIVFLSENQIKLLDQDIVYNQPSYLLMHLELIHETETDEAYKLGIKNDWKNALGEYKENFKKQGPTSEGCFNIAVCLEHLNSYEMSRTWFAEALRFDIKSTEVLLGLAVTSFKLNEIGSCIYFCDRIMEVDIAKDGRVYFLMALCSKVINSIDESTLHYLLLLQRCPEDRLSPVQSTHDWDENIPLEKWMYKSNIPFFRRFDKKKLKHISNYDIIHLESTHVFVPDHDKAYIIINGMIKVRDHNHHLTNPKLLWRIRCGHYLYYPYHKFLFDDPYIWLFVDRNTCVLSIPSEDFEALLKDTKQLNSVILTNVLCSFKLFKSISDNCIDSLVQESMKIKKFKKGQLIRRKIGVSAEGKGVFGIIISGLVDVKREDGHDIGMKGRGDYFAEEFVFKEMRGSASYGDFYAKSDTVEIGFIFASDILKLPEYELEKLKNNLSTFKRTKSRKETHTKNNSFWL